MKALKSKICNTVWGYKVSIEYDHLGNEVYYKDSEGYVRKARYDEKGKAEWTFDGTEEVFYEYNADGKLSRQIQANGMIILFEYDWKRNIIKDTYIYGDSGRVIVNDYEYEYDQNGNQVYFKSSGNGYERWWKYDENGHLFYSNDNSGKKWQYKRDIFGRETYSKDCDGKEQWTEYDENGNISSYTSSNGNEIKLLHFENKKKIYSRYSNGPIKNEQWWHYDEKGNKIYSLQSNGFEESWKYNEKDKLIHYKNSSGTEYANIYVGNENRIILKDNKGRVQDLLYDKDWDLIYIVDWNGNEQWLKYHKVM